ncbi:hypothetical protein XarjCFBP7645_02520 [Xanthomonas arboricola]|uniref:Uncharacterized protein n=1 Tax=Xanthomonas arboricola TaxID=56448 RepID=A0A2S7AH25_9XANT|nr:hypothetical protein XarjCFBP7645_02520 [Xanthomonas arboricola]
MIAILHGGAVRQKYRNKLATRVTESQSASLAILHGDQLVVRIVAERQDIPILVLDSDQLASGIKVFCTVILRIDTPARWLAIRGQDGDSLVNVFIENSL